MGRKRWLLCSASALLAIVSLSAMPVVTAAPNGGAGPAGKKQVTNNAYIVQLAEDPVSAYKGGIAGYRATAPRKGQKIDPNGPAVVSYLAFLAARQDAVLASVGGAKKLHSYGFVFNGFAAELTPAQAAKLAQTKGVLRSPRMKHARSIRHPRRPFSD